MNRRFHILNLFGATLALSLLLGSSAFAGIITGQPIRALQPPTNGNAKQKESGGSNSSTGGTAPGGTSSTTPTSTSGSPTTAQVPLPATSNVVPVVRLQTAQLKTCQARSAAISTIMSRASTRAQNQITLFSGIATKVESYYEAQGKTAANYSQLVAAVNAAETQANTDLSALSATSTFNCSSDNPVATVGTYQSDLKTVQGGLLTLRSTIQNLISGVAKAEGVTLSPSATNGAAQ